MKTFLILRRTGYASPPELEKAASRSARVCRHEFADRVRWIRSYLTAEPGGRIGTVCIFQATDSDSLREHARRANLPCDDIIPVSGLVILEEDQPIAPPAAA